MKTKTENFQYEDLIPQCIEVFKSEGKASVSLLQRRLHLSYMQACTLMDELEGRGIVGPAKGTATRDILIKLDDDTGSTPHPQPLSPVEAERVASDTARPTTAREDYLAANPGARQLQASQVAEFQRRLAELMEGAIPLPSLLNGLIDKSEQARQIGIVLVEFVDTLPGKRLTPDFYEQTKHLFVDGRGQSVPLHILELFIRHARKHEQPITTIAAALDSQQLLLGAAGGEFALVAESQRTPPVLHPPANPLNQLKDIFAHLEIGSVVDRFRSSPNYCPGGQLRPDLAAALKVELKPKLLEFDAVREWIKREIGV